MDWREAQMGAWVGEGWVPLVDELHSKVLEIDPDVRVDQVKEKFGTLRYYFSSDLYDQVEAVVREYESRSAVTCETCGGPGYLQGKYWVKTLCDACAEAGSSKPAQ